MNRLVSPLEDTLPVDPAIHHDFAASVDDTRPAPSVTDENAPFATFAPMHYERGYAYPLLVWLHGSDGNERQLRQLMPLISLRNYVAVAPRGTVTSDEDDLACGWAQSAEHVESAEQRVFDCIASATDRFHINPHRVFVAGYGYGGTMAVRVAWNSPDRFAGAATIGGPLPCGGQPLARVNQLRRLPLLLSTGSQAVRYDESRVCADLRLLHSAGFTAAIRQYPCGDELRTTMLSDLDRWIMEIVCCGGAAKTCR